MNTNRLSTFLASTLAVTLVAISSGCADNDPNMDQNMSRKPMSAKSVDRSTVNRLTADWPERPKLGANLMIAKYGAPQEATSERLIWHNAGPFKRITVLNLETPHDFPLPHVDFLEHTITYNVPQDKVGDLIEFDGSSTINRTVGELSARCDLEGHNILTLNLDHDIVTGKKSVEEARQAFGEIVQQDVMGKHPAYVEALQFEPAKMSVAAFSDKSVIPGSPVRAAEAEEAQLAAGGDKMDDAEVLAMVIAIDHNEILAAMQAQKKKISQPVLNYAKMLHQEHGMHMGKTMKLGQQIGVTPINTADVEKLQVKGAGELAALVPLDGEQFASAYVAAMIKDHTEVLNMIDNQLLKATDNDALKKHLTETRSHIANHLEEAKKLQSNM